MLVSRAMRKKDKVANRALKLRDDDVMKALFGKGKATS